MLKEEERTLRGEERSALLSLDEIARTGARQMLMAALEAEGRLITTGRSTTFDNNSDSYSKGAYSGKPARAEHG